MVIDIPQERGMTHADTKYGDDMKNICQFPYFFFVKPFNADYMALLYTILFASKNVYLNCNVPFPLRCKNRLFAY